MSFSMNFDCFYMTLGGGNYFEYKGIYLHSFAGLWQVSQLMNYEAAHRLIRAVR